MQYLRSESSRELLEIDDAVVILVKLLKEVASVVLEGRVVLGQLLDLTLLQIINVAVGV